jgi:hypothetical protein
LQHGGRGTLQHTCGMMPLALSFKDQRIKNEATFDPE